MDDNDTLFLDVPQPQTTHLSLIKMDYKYVIEQNEDSSHIGCNIFKEIKRAWLGDDDALFRDVPHQKLCISA